MKKALSLLIVIATCLSLLMAFTSCAPKHPIDAFIEKVEKADSCQMSMTMSDVPLFGTISVTTKIDGNIQYIPATIFGEESYTELVGDVTYKYTKNDSGKWTKAKVSSTDAEADDSSIFSEESMEQIFNSENYEKVSGKENTYRQKSDVTFEGYEDVVITIEDDSCTLEMNATSNGMVFGLTVVISKIGKVKLTLPEVG